MGGADMTHTRPKTHKFTCTLPKENGYRALTKNFITSLIRKLKVNYQHFSFLACEKELLLCIMIVNGVRVKLNGKW